MTLLVLCFRIYTFFSLIFVICYLFKRYGLLRVKSDIHKKESEQQELVARTAVLTAELFHQEKRVEREQLEASILKKKIDLWCAQVQEDIAKRVADQNNNYALVKQRSEVQRIYYQNAQTQSQVLPQLFSSAEKLLRKEMVGGKSREWLDSVLSDISRESA